MLSPDKIFFNFVNLSTSFEYIRYWSFFFLIIFFFHNTVSGSESSISSEFKSKASIEPTETTTLPSTTIESLESQAKKQSKRVKALGDALAVFETVGNTLSAIVSHHDDDANSKRRRKRAITSLSTLESLILSLNATIYKPGVTANEINEKIDKISEETNILIEFSKLNDTSFLAEEASRLLTTVDSVKSSIDNKLTEAIQNLNEINEKIASLGGLTITAEPFKTVAPTFAIFTVSTDQVTTLTGSTDQVTTVTGTFIT